METAATNVTTLLIHDQKTERAVLILWDFNSIASNFTTYTSCSDFTQDAILAPQTFIWNGCLATCSVYTVVRSVATQEEGPEFESRCSSFCVAACPGAPSEPAVSVCCQMGAVWAALLVLLFVCFSCFSQSRWTPLPVQLAYQPIRIWPAYSVLYVTSAAMKRVLSCSNPAEDALTFWFLMFL